MAVTIERVPGDDGLIQAFKTKRQQMHAPQGSLGQLLRRQRRPAASKRATELAEESNRAIETEEPGREMRNAENKGTHGWTARNTTDVRGR